MSKDVGIVLQLKEVLKDVDPKKAKVLVREATSKHTAARKFEDDLEMVMRSVGSLSLSKAVKITKEVHSRVFPEFAKPPSAPRKPNPFLEFVKQQLPEVKATQPYLSHQDRIRFIAKMWHETKDNATTKTRKRSKCT